MNSGDLLYPWVAVVQIEPKHLGRLGMGDLGQGDSGGYPNLGCYFAAGKESLSGQDFGQGFDTGRVGNHTQSPATCSEPPLLFASA